MFLAIKILFDGMEQEIRNFIRVSLCKAKYCYTNKSTGNRNSFIKWHQISSNETLNSQRKDSISSRS